MEKIKRTDICGESTITVGEAGRTGDWRTTRPVVDNQRCTPAKKGQPSCFLCWLYCPEAAISKTVPIEIDLEHCKGCGVCAEECPATAILMVEEARFRATRSEAYRLGYNPENG